MKKQLTCFALILSVLMLVSINLEAGEIKVFRLKYARPYSVENVIKSLFGNSVKVACADTINAVVVNSSDKEILEQIEKLVAVLDRKPATFRFTVRSDTGQKQRSATMGTQSGQAQLNMQSNRQKSFGERTITALEFAKAALTDETIRVFHLTSLPDAVPVVITTTRGLKISARMAESNQILAQLWYAEGGSDASDILLTELSVPAGQWFSFGGMDDSINAMNHSASVLAGKGDISVNKTGNRIDRRFMLKIDLLY